MFKKKGLSAISPMLPKLLNSPEASYLVCQTQKTRFEPINGGLAQYHAVARQGAQKTVCHLTTKCSSKKKGDSFFVSKLLTRKLL